MSLYEERLDRIRKVINLEPVPEIPVVYNASSFSPRYMGMTIAEFCDNPEAAVDVTIAAMDRLGGLDAINLPLIGKTTVLLSSAWLSRVARPGRELPPDVVWQVRETEVMTRADYDTIIEKGWNAFLAEYLPRVVDMVEYREAAAWVRANMVPQMNKFIDRGYVVMAVPGSAIPFESFCGGRSMEKFYLDLYQIPDKVEAAMKAVFPEVVGACVGLGKGVGAFGMWLGGWRSASALLNPKLWNRFVWPYFVELTYALIDAGVVPILHFDQNWTRDLGRLAELPAKKVIFNPDGMTDVRKFKELVGDRMCMMGDVPATLFAAGTPDDMYGYVRELVRDVGPTGLILAPGCDAPFNTKPENMEAFVAASRQFGKVGI